MIKIHRILLGALPLALVSTLAPSAKADEPSRENTWEVSGEGVYLASNSVSFKGGGGDFKVKSLYAGGAVAIGYRF